MFSLRELTEEEGKKDNTLYDLEVIRGVEVYEKYDVLKTEKIDLEWELDSLDSQRTILLEERDGNNANEDITKYSYEPWHIRYVGNIASYIYNNNLTLEEYKERESKK